MDGMATRKRNGQRKAGRLDVRSHEADVQLDQPALEIIAVQMADFELASRVGIQLPNPLSLLEAVEHGLAAGFYWGLNHHVAIPMTSQDIVERNLDAYAAGVLARELIDLGGQDAVYTEEPHKIR